MATFTLNSIPGFADQSDAICAADDPALGLILGRISSNAAFGMARLEVFQAWYYDGQTVALPVSPIDGYSYSRDELTYVWGPHLTGNKDSNWASYGPPWTMWYAAYNVDQATGDVSCATGYRGNPDHADRQAHTNDGVLKVWTIAQRQMSTMTMAAVPYFKPHSATDFVTDKPLGTSLLKDLNNSAKASVVNAEVIYVGEFSDGETAPAPVSPVDGYAYTASQILWMTSLRWTMDDDGGAPPNAVIPNMSKGQLKGWATSVGSSRLVSASVTYDTGGGGSATTYPTGRVAVFAFCVRNGQTKQVTVPGTACPWRDGAYPISGSGGGTGPATVAVLPGTSVTVAYVSGLWSVSGPIGTTLGAGSGNFYGSWDANGDPSTAANSYGTGTAASRWVNDTVNSAELLGAWTDASGNVLPLTGNPFKIGNGPVILTVPAGAAFLSMGISDGGSFSDNSGSLTLHVTSSGGLAFTGHSFGEIDTSTFFPGSTLRASTMLQLEKNVEEAWCSPEFFGPQSHAHGDTVALPTSLIDGYTYSRDELYYVWDMASTGPDAGDNHNRMTCEDVGVNPTTGAVVINSYETSTSSDGWFLNHDGTLRVIVVGMRSAEVPALTTSGSQPPAGVTGGNPDSSDGEVTFNGV